MTLPLGRLTGYASRFSVRPGERVDFHVSAAAGAFAASVVRLLGPAPAAGAEPPCVPCPELAPELLGTGGARAVRTGSCMVAPAPPLGAGVALSVWVQPTLVPCDHPQAILGGDGGGLLLDEAGHAVWSLVDGEGGRRSVRSAAPLRRGAWHLLVACCDGERATMTLDVAPVPGAPERVSAAAPTLALGPTLVAAAAPDGAGSTCDHFNGKLEAPCVWARALSDEEVAALAAGEQPAAELLARWRFAAAPGVQDVRDEGPHALHARLLGGPTRAVTSHAWTGAEVDFRNAPEQYDAIHFHEDDVDDAGWPADATLQVAPGTRSGVYALRLEAGDDVDLIPFFVTPPRAGGARPPAVLVLPTFTYLAYGNSHGNPELAASHALMAPDDAPGPGAHERFVDAHVADRSLYDHHRDGSMCCLASRLRPLHELRPDYRYGASGAPRNFSADLAIVAWLERHGHAYDVLTDEELHHEGVAALAPYRVLLTGSHPEYSSAALLDALEGFVAGGGNLMSLGGNGFYWVTSVDPARPHAIEVRRAHVGVRTGENAPGESHHQTSGEHGGLWRHRGRAPQRLTGVGFCAYGWTAGAPYARAAGVTADTPGGWALEGLSGTLIGAGVGPYGGPAADELDRADVALGTSPHAIVLGSSQGLHDAHCTAAIEEYPQLPVPAGDVNPDVRADLVLTEGRDGRGSVFATGSIAYTLGLVAEDGGDTDLARVLGNVLARFAEHAAMTFFHEY